MSNQQPTIGIIGCGYVGLTLAAVLAAAGYRVHAIETNPARLEAIKSGRSFFYEAGADALIRYGLKTGNLLPDNTFDTLSNCDIVFSCVGTPDNPDGSSNLTYVFAAAEAATCHMDNGAIFVQKSTVPVGAGAQVKKLFKEAGRKTAYVSCPEFSREGTAISDTLWFDRVVCGSDDQLAAARVLELHRTIQRQQETIATIAGLDKHTTGNSPQYLTTTVSSAELIKVTANAFLALKISFANAIAKLADAAGADITAVMDGVGSDQRIGRAFLKAGRGYGGGCFPKDVSGLIRSAEDHGVDMEIMHAATAVNDSMPHYIIQKAGKALGKGADWQDTKVAVLGLSFKAGTSDTRRSPAITIANTLADLGAAVHTYDPKSMDEAKPLLRQSIQLAKNVNEALADAAAVFIATDWREFIDLDWTMIAKNAPDAVIVDCTNRLDSNTVRTAGLRYVGVGRS